MPAKPPRFRVERYGDKFAVVDTIAIRIHEFASREAAELECDARNGSLRPKTSEAAELRILREKLRKEGFLVPEERAVLRRRPPSDLMRLVRPKLDHRDLMFQIRGVL